MPIIKDLKALLHCHSLHSNLDGVSSPKQYIDACIRREIPYIGLTEHGQLGNQYDLFQAGKGTGVKTLCSIEAYVDITPPEQKEMLGHLTMHTYTNEGRKNLYKLYNLSHGQMSKARWGHNKPKMTWEQLATYSKGIFVGTSCLSGVAGKFFMKGRPDLAEESIVRLIDIYGKDNVFAEFIPAEASWSYDRKTRAWTPNPCLPFTEGRSNYTEAYQLWLFDKIVSKHKLKAVTTTDSHFVEPDEHQLQTLVLQASEGGWSFHDSTHLFSKEEIYAKLSYLPGYNAKMHDEMIVNGEDFASKIEYEGHLCDSKPKLPMIFDNEAQEISALMSAIKMDRLVK